MSKIKVPIRFKAAIQRRLDLRRVRRSGFGGSTLTINEPCPLCEEFYVENAEDGERCPECPFAKHYNKDLGCANLLYNLDCGPLVNTFYQEKAMWSKDVDSEVRLLLRRLKKNYHKFVEFV